MIALVTTLLTAIGGPSILLGGLGFAGSVATLIRVVGLPRLGHLIDLHRSWLLLLVVAGAAAALYAWGSHAERDRNRLRGWANLECIAVGSQLEVAGEKRGVSCARAIAALVRFRTETAEASARALRDNIDETGRRTAADAAASRRNADRAERAAEAMESVNAKVGPDDRVGGDWLRAFNDAAGLRAR